MKESASKQLETLFSRYPALATCRADIFAAAETICGAYRAEEQKTDRAVDLRDL